MSLNYSKWDNLVDDSDDSDDDDKPAVQRQQQRAQAVDPNLMGRLKELKAEDPRKLDQLNKELELMKQQALRQKQASATAGGGRGGGGGGALPSNGSPGAVDVLANQSEVLQQQLADIDKKKKDMDENMERLERLAAAGDGESVLRFFESQGMSRDDIQRMMGGSDADSQEVLSATATKAAEKHEDPDLNARAERALQLADEMKVTLSDNDDSATAAGPAPAPPRVAVGAALSEPLPPLVETLVPTYHQKVAGGSVVLCVEMPELAKVGDAELDVARRTFKLRGHIHNAAATSDSSSARKKEYLLSTELAAAVDPDAVAAKWSKKTKTLTVTCPIVG